MSNNLIKEYVNTLSNNLTKITLIEFINKIHEINNKNIDLSFMNYFMELIKHEDEFIVHHEKLIEYNVFTSKNASANIKQRLENFNLKEGKDYKVFVGQKRYAVKRTGRGGSNKKSYLLTPRTFKICLIRSKNTYKYANYYLFLEECLK